MTLTDIKNLVSRLGLTLEAGGPTASDGDLADQYADACQEASARLAQCACMIDEGSPSQALMLAEENPHLLDAIASLTFARSSDWREGCSLNGLRQAPKILREDVHKLNDLYAKGNRADQTRELYREFRGAMAARKNGIALGIIRTIAQLDPADGEALREVARLERVLAEESLKALKLGLSAGDDAQIIRLLVDCEKLKVVDAPELAQARDVRSRVAAQNARQEIALILPTLEDLQGQGRWQQCGERASRINSLRATHALPLPLEEEAKVARAIAYFDSCRAEALHKAQFKESLGAVSDCADQLQSSAVARNKQVLEEMEEAQLRLKKVFNKARDFSMPIPEALTSRITQISESIDNEIERLRKRRKARNIILLGGASVFLLILVAGGYYVLRASQYASELDALSQSRKAISLKKLVVEIQEKHALYAQFPALKSALFTAEGWLESVSAEERAAEKAILVAESLAASGFAEKSPEEAQQIFDLALGALDRLPPDIGGIIRPPFSASQGKFALWLGEQRQLRLEACKADLITAREQWEVVLASCESYDECRKALEQLKGTVGILLELVHSPVEKMQLPQGTKQEVFDLTASVREMNLVLEAYAEAWGGLSSATNLEEYIVSLTKLAEVKLPKSSVVQAAQSVISRGKLSAHQILGSLLLPQAPEVWATIDKSEDLETKMRPDQARENEVERLIDLINNENIAGVWEAVLLDRNGSSTAHIGRPIFSQGKLDQSNEKVRGSGDAKITRSGLVYDPVYSGKRLDFRRRDFPLTKSNYPPSQKGWRVDGEKESDASKALKKFKLKRLVSGDGSAYRENILSTIDRIKNTQSAPSLVKAYALQELYRIVQVRPGAWGVVWAPALANDMASLRAQTEESIGSGDWMVPAQKPLAEQLDAWFKERQDFSYATQQSLNRSLARSALEAGLVLCGFVGLNGELVNSGRDIPGIASRLWGWDESGTVAVIFARPLGSPEESFKPRNNGLVLSPVFGLPLDEAKVVADALKFADIPPDLSDPYRDQILPSFASPGEPSTTSKQ